MHDRKQRKRKSGQKEKNRKAQNEMNTFRKTSIKRKKSVRPELSSITHPFFKIPYPYIYNKV